MMTNMNVSLPENLKDYVEAQVADGGYGTTSEYLRELIREDKKRKAQERLETLLLEGLESGDAIPVTPDFWKQLWERVDTRRKGKHGGDSV
ncbi:addiction module antitoxin [Capsulimonas corticalis]|uniref:Addiction module antitoxin n=1 Tax=Capsulimonas corticalis TaxID=2219043 RepID=A0A402D1J8_9BACT|nr:type II toxin-antitoxin system ParD family antitoxin [Capsulimonas corticalis]BDI28608.1 addiction module antitoxin [Capsulimonas corticalis]